MICFASWFLFIIYASAAVGLFIYGINCYIMLYLFFRRKQKNLLEEKEYIEGFYNHYKM